MACTLSGRTEIQVWNLHDQKQGRTRHRSPLPGSGTDSTAGSPGLGGFSLWSCCCWMLGVSATAFARYVPSDTCFSRHQLLNTSLVFRSPALLPLPWTILLCPRLANPTQQSRPLVPVICCCVTNSPWLETTTLIDGLSWFLWVRNLGEAGQFWLGVGSLSCYCRQVLICFGTISKAASCSYLVLG